MEVRTENTGVRRHDESLTCGRKDLDEIEQNIKNRYDKLFFLFKYICLIFNPLGTLLHEVSDENFTSTVKTRLCERLSTTRSNFVTKKKKNYHHVWLCLDVL